MIASTSVLPLSFSRDTLAQRFGIMTGVAIYVALLVFIYSSHISPQFSYLGYVLQPVSLGYLFIAYSTAWLPSLWMPVQLTHPSQVVYWLLYIVVFIPSSLMPLLSLDRSMIEILLLLAVLLSSFLAISIIYHVPNLSIGRLQLHPWAFWGTMTCVTTAMIALVVATFGISFSLPGIFEVYDVRSEFKEASTGRLAGYSVSWLGNVIFPLFIAVALTKRNMWLLLLGITGQLFIYSTTGFKSILFSAGLIIALLLALYRNARLFGIFMIWGVNVLVALTWVLDLITNNVIFSSLFVRRLIITPGILTGWYYDFFQDNPKVMLGHSIFRSFVDYPYDRLPPLLIGQAYFGREETYANANFWADAFANFGFGGIFAFTAVLMLLLWLFDGLVKKRNRQQFTLAVLLLGIPALTLSNSALLTSLLTHGIISAWLVLFFLPKNALVRSDRLQIKPRVALQNEKRVS